MFLRDDQSRRPRLVSASAIGTLWLLCAGCGGVQPVIGGTPGTLLIDDQPMSDMQIIFYELDASPPEPVAFGVSAAEGEFRLLQMDALGPFLLPAGDYRCTVETAGAPVQLPPEYLQPEKSPVVVNWTPDDSPLTIQVSTTRAARK